MDFVPEKGEIVLVRFPKGNHKTYIDIELIYKPYIGSFYMYDPRQIELQIPEGESSSLSDLAYLSFNSYDCENQMIADMLREFTEEKLLNIFNSECSETAFYDAASRIIESVAEAEERSMPDIGAVALK
ncbi:hypothetical protein [Bacillus sp. FSL K6-0993]|uniref:hypothetical protein n=1 Tax=Bacillus sp. FSL K6-0993 TaxID=2921456 RepID=UPI0030ED6CE7